MDDFDKFYNKALRFLSFRPRSEKEVKDKLQKFKIKKIATTEAQKKNEAQNFSTVIDRVIAKLKEQKFVNDLEFGKWWVEQRTHFKPRSSRLIKIELRQKGLSQEIIEGIISNDEFLISNELEQAKKLIGKKLPRYKNLSRQEIYQKLGSFLGRRGFDWETIKQAIDEVVKKGV